MVKKPKNLPFLKVIRELFYIDFEFYGVWSFQPKKKCSNYFGALKNDFLRKLVNVKLTFY